MRNLLKFIRHIFILIAAMLAICCKEAVEDNSKTTVVQPPAEAAAPLEAPVVNSSKAAEANPPFDRLLYDQVIAYDYEGSIDNGFAIIDENGKLHESVKHAKGLTQEQVNHVTDFLGANETYGGGTASCFEPRMGIVFYKNSKVVAHISICLYCNSLRSSVDIPATTLNQIQIGDEYVPAHGFSKIGQEQLLAFCRELNFSNCKGYSLN